MPIYEYSCSKCKAEFEELVFGQDPKIKCPECGSAKVSKQMSAFAHKCDGNFVSSSGGSSCSGCTSGSCSSCH